MRILTAKNLMNKPTGDLIAAIDITTVFRYKSE